jgi:L-cysteine S-thiosulfotransferase
MTTSVREHNVRARVLQVETAVHHRLRAAGEAMRRGLRIAALAAVMIGACASAGLAAFAQDAGERQIGRYRQMLKSDPWSNPGLLEADRGETLWQEKGGPKRASLAACDLGKGPGKVEGAFAELPRYFADADQVMDLEARLVWCMEKLQGFDRSQIVKHPYSKADQAGTELEALATYVAGKSRGFRFTPSLDHAREREALAVGEALFFRRQGPMDFACSTCHADSGKRIRLQGLAVLSRPAEAREVMGQWPAYRVSQGTIMTLQHRISDCFWQMRLPLMDYSSKVAVALTMYLVHQAKGGEISAPQIRR